MSDSQALRTPKRARDCDGCLGSCACWVCSGRGTLALRDGDARSCTACAGSGVCSLCRPQVVIPRARERAQQGQAAERATGIEPA